MTVVYSTMSFRITIIVLLLAQVQKMMNLTLLTAMNAMKLGSANSAVYIVVFSALPIKCITNLLLLVRKITSVLQQPLARAKLLLLVTFMYSLMNMIAFLNLCVTVILAAISTTEEAVILAITTCKDNVLTAPKTNIVVNAIQLLQIIALCKLTKRDASASRTVIN